MKLGIFLSLILIVRDVQSAGLRANAPGQRALDGNLLPQNVAVYAGQSVVLTCWIDEETVTSRVQWMEYAHTPSGGFISDGGFLLPGHPHFSRYFLNVTNPRQFDLHIYNVTVEDGGVYVCVDQFAVITEIQRGAAQLIVIHDKQSCTSTLPENGVIVEYHYYSIECQLLYQGLITPNMQWFGPGHFNQAQTSTVTRVWSGMNFYADRLISGQQWRSLANFTNNFLPVPVDMAENIPDFEEWFESVTVTVVWGPGNMSVSPVHPDNIYEVGEVVACYADANPDPNYEWLNTKTGERSHSATFVVQPHWLGEQVMRCTATNIIQGRQMEAHTFVTVHVPIPATTPPTTTPTTTTTAPPVSNCLDLSGRWESRGPTPGVMCLEVNPDNGGMNGVMRNATDTFWLDIVGTTDFGSYHHASWTAIWPLNRAVSSFIAECSRCNGYEILLVNVVSRTKGGPPCGTPGQIQYSAQYEFVRHAVTSCPPVTMPT